MRGKGEGGHARNAINTGRRAVYRLSRVTLFTAHFQAMNPNQLAQLSIVLSGYIQGDLNVSHFRCERFIMYRQVLVYFSLVSFCE